MPRVPDTTIVDLHRVPYSPIAVDRIEGEAWRIPKGSGTPEPLGAGDDLEVGDTVALAPLSSLDAGPVHLRGGPRGRAHGLVSDRDLRVNPTRAQVPQLLLQLTEIEEQMSELGGDPLAVQPGPESPFERAASAEFALCNLVPTAARELPESLARTEGAVVLFINEETAFVAMSSLSVQKLRSVMEAVQRPVNPHMVEPTVLEELLERAYGAPSDA